MSKIFGSCVKHIDLCLNPDVTVSQTHGIEEPVSLMHSKACIKFFGGYSSFGLLEK